MFEGIAHLCRAEESRCMRMCLKSATPAAPSATAANPATTTVTRVTEATVAYS